MLFVSHYSFALNRGNCSHSSNNLCTQTIQLQSITSVISFKKHTCSASASVVIKLVIFPDANCFRASCVSFKDLRNTAATYNQKVTEINKNEQIMFYVHKKPSLKLKIKE